MKGKVILGKRHSICKEKCYAWINELIILEEEIWSIILGRSHPLFVALNRTVYRLYLLDQINQH